ncbi:MAG TPA: TRL-like family protein [Verrucomicrobiae bacterium]|nr:TRL-like family protein [Verrucomicrobiae bacterium]
MSGLGGSAVGGLYSQVDGAVIAGAPVGQTTSTAKVGTAESTSIIGFATGDSSIQAAMQAGGITKIHHVDYKVMNVLGIYVKYTTVVYGE